MSKDWIAKQVKAEVVVGAFVLLVFIGLGYFTIILSRDTWFGGKHYVEVIFSDVMGLSDGDSVIIRGMTVGKVKALRMGEGGVHVVAALDVAPDIRKGYRARIVSTSILGGLHMEINEGPADAERVPPGAILRGERPSDLMDDAAELMRELREQVVSGGVLESLRVTMDKVRLIVERLEAGEGTIGHLLSSDDTLYNDLAASVASLKTITSRLVDGEGTLGRLMSADDTLYDDLAASASSLKTITSRLVDGEGTLGRLMSADDTLYDDLSATAASLRQVAERIEKGEGSLGKLLTDDTLATEIQETVTEIRATVDDFRETSPVVTFTSIFFGAF